VAGSVPTEFGDLSSSKAMWMSKYTVEELTYFDEYLHEKKYFSLRISHSLLSFVLLMMCEKRKPGALWRASYGIGEATIGIITVCWYVVAFRDLYLFRFFDCII